MFEAAWPGAQGSVAGGEGPGAQLRPLAVSLLCGMAHSTQRTRAELWTQNGLDLLLSLLQEQVRTAITLGSWFVADIL